MTYAIRWGLVAVACALLVAAMARARAADVNIGGGPPRAELFELRWKSDLGPNASTLAPKLTQPFFIPKHILGDAVYGIALSYHNDEGCACKAGERCATCRIDWSRVANNKIAFVFLKATQGARYKDPAFEYHWRALAQHKIHRGARHFMAADEDPIEQADYFIERLETVGNLMAGDLPPVLELERDLRRDAANKWIVVSETGQRLDFWQGQEPDEIVGKILKWLNRVEQKTGRVPIIYTSRGWWMEHIKDEKKFALLRRYPLWIADYPESGRHAHDAPKVPNNQPWTIWQFTENGKLEEAGIIAGNVEVSVFRGTLARFRQAMKVSAVEAEIARTEDNKVIAPAAQAPAAQQVAAANPQQVSDASAAAFAVPASAAPSAAAASAPPDRAATAANDQPVTAVAAASAAVAAAPSSRSDQPTQTPQPVQQTPQPQASPESTAPPQAQTSRSDAANAAPPEQASDANNSPQTAAKAVQIEVSKTLEVQAPPSPATQTAAVARATQPTGTPASQQPGTVNTVPQAAANQGETARSVKLTQQAPVGANASERVNAAPAPTGAASGEQKAPPAPQPAAVNRSSAEEAAASKPAGAAPAAGGEKTKTENQKANAANQQANTASGAPPFRTAQRNSGQRAAAEKAAEENTPGERAPTDKPGGERIMVEIELLNGRKLRVDAAIDPEVLQRLISAIDK